MYSSITDLRNAVSQHIVGLHKYRWNPTVISSIWNKLLHDRRMKKRSMTRKRGGASYALAGAPLEYAMVPGSAFTTDPAVAVYDRFPIDPTVNPQVASDLDVFFGSALSRGCGVEDTSLKVPADMGSNQVGGRKRKIRTSRNRRYHGGASSDVGLLTKGADTLSSLGFHPYMDAGRPTLPHSLTHQWQGRVDQIPTSPDPTNPTWDYATEKPYPVMDTNQLATRLAGTDYLYQTTTRGPSTTGGASKRSKRKTAKKLRKSRSTRRR